MKWITRPATLDAWTVDVDILQNHPLLVAEVVVRGRCKRKRGNLWTHTEVVEVVGGAYNLSDLILHVELVCEQSRPATQTQFERAMIGEHWDQPELPF